MTSTSLLSVSDIHRMPWNSPVPGVAGFITRLFAPMARAGWSLQNGRIRDPDTGTEVEFMLSKRDVFLNPSTDVHRWIEITAGPDGSVTWKAQEPRNNVNGGKPFAKIEVEREAFVRVLDRRPSEPDLFTQSRSTSATAQASTGATMPSHPAPAGSPAVVPSNITLMPPPETRGSIPQPTQAIRQLGALYVLAREQAVEAIRLSGVTDPTNEEILSACGLIFVQGTRDGLYQQLDPDQIVIARDPTAAETLQPNLHRLRQLAEGRESTLNLLLIGSGILKSGQRWQDLDESKAAQVVQQEEIMRVLKVG